jgi:P pilus assembly chaperone PapD
MVHRPITVSLTSDEYEMWQALQSRLRRLDIYANNSTPFRAGIRMLSALDDGALKEALLNTPPVPRGPRRNEVG